MLPYLLSVVTALGWVGAIVGLVAYYQVSRGRWAADSIQFQAANICAMSMLSLVAAVNGVWPSLAANVAWMVIGAQAILVIVRARRAGRPQVTRVEVAPAEPDVEHFAVGVPAAIR
ncbi:CBU_0592 family membrane protein [Isoptericola croceus]|uniref:CBU_0592 family membrane protein n=1 Tax=Isoptericola croceus TaxID=3031406 RepID=UPI0023F6A76B|nr:hypothetical protein [Isoptericola croceus]